MTTSDPLVGAKPVFIFSKLAGCFPTNLPSTGYTCVVILGSVVGQILSWYRAETIKPEKFSESIITVMELIEDTFVFAIIASGAFSFRHFHSKRQTKKYLTIHESLLKLGLVPTYRKKRSAFLASLCLLGLGLNIEINYTRPFLAIISNALASFLPKIQVHLYIVQYFAFLEISQDQLTTLMKGIKFKSPKFLESSVNIHSLILKHVQQTRDMYMIVASLVVTQSTLSLMVYVYLFVEYPSESSGLLVMVYETIGIALVIHASEQTKFKAEAFNIELFRIMRESEELCNDGKLQLYVTMKENVNFTACGFFNIGYPLVTSIVAATTTYIVILIQFT